MGKVCIFYKEVELDWVLYNGEIKCFDGNFVLIVWYEGLKGGLGMLE